MRIVSSLAVAEPGYINISSPSFPENDISIVNHYIIIFIIFFLIIFFFIIIIIIAFVSNG